ncbi:MAG: NnrS family protein [Halomonas sp.]|uniref:NnrS family protein n=1 Tax=Halomonas sp. TaxID=1486246 RepID=UPI003F91E9DA
MTDDARPVRPGAATTPAWRWLFPLAAVHAALLVPLSLLALYSWHGLALLSTPAAHGRELLFGFALTVIAGYLLGPQPRRWLMLLVGLWLVARLGGLLWPGSVVVIAADTGFALLVGWKLVPRFRVAKKWRNQMLSPLLGLICLLAVISLTWRYLDSLPPMGLLIQHSVLWLVLLMAFMGGRVLAPAVNGYLKSHWKIAGAGVQPRIEAALVVLLGTAPLLLVPSWSLLRFVAALWVLVAGMLILWRIARWQPWLCRARPDLLGLLIGYAWLAVGLLLLASTWWQQHYVISHTASAILHAFTVGALGTLASGIMLRQAIMRAKARPQDERILLPLALLFSLAAVLRLWSMQAGSDWLLLLWASALLWSLAWLLTAWRLIHWLRRMPVRRGAHA